MRPVAERDQQHRARHSEGPPLADISNAGMLFAFAAVAVSVMSLRRTDPDRPRPFRTPAVWAVAPLTITGCMVLYCRLPFNARMALPIWSGIGLLLYFCYGYRNSHVGRGLRPGTAWLQNLV